MDHTRRQPLGWAGQTTRIIRLVDGGAIGIARDVNLIQNRRVPQFTGGKFLVSHQPVPIATLHSHALTPVQP